MDSYTNSFSSLSDLSQMFAAEDRKPPTLNYLFDHHHPPHHPAVTGGGGTKKERERRGKMANMYTILQTFLPNLASNKQASREKIVTEAIELIKRLEADKSRLEQQLVVKSKASSVMKVSPSSAASVSMCNQVTVAFEIKWRRDDRMRTRMMVKLMEVFEMYGAEILTASVVVANDGDEEGLMVTTTAAVTAAIVVNGGDRSDVVVEGIKRDLMRLLSQV